MHIYFCHPFCQVSRQARCCSTPTDTINFAGTPDPTTGHADDQSTCSSMNDETLIAKALAILARQMRTTDHLSTPSAVRDYLRLSLAGREHEVFVVVLLDAQHRVLRCEELFRGTLTQTSVYPREVVKLALAANAASAIFAHNHPSGSSNPSRADELLNQQLKTSLALVDIKVLDHFLVAGSDWISFAECGLL